jgi:hypothetical protein
LGDNAFVGYTLRVPFRLPPGRHLAAGQFSLGSIEVTLESREPFYILHFRGLESEEAAVALLNRVYAGLLWVALLSQEGIAVSLELQPVELRDEPAPPHSEIAGAYGLERDGLPAIFPDDKPVGFYYMPPPSVHQDMPLALFADRLREGMTREAASAMHDERLRLAVDVFLSSSLEGSRRGLFLSRVTVLEILAERQPVAQEVVALIERWQAEVTELAGQGQIDVDRANSLRGRLEDLRRESIRRAIRTLVADALGDEDARKADELYSLRSGHLHEGELTEEEVGRLVPDITRLVVQVLRARLFGLPPE